MLFTARNDENISPCRLEVPYDDPSELFRPRRDKKKRAPSRNPPRAPPRRHASRRR